MSKKVVVDASPLIGLVLVEGLIWLPQLFGQVFVPESVKEEV
jgi:predicted nucleic acid-binding protein